MNYHESPKAKRLKIEIKNSTELAALNVEGLSMVHWFDTGEQYEFKVEYKQDFLSQPDSYLFKLTKNPSEKASYELNILDSGYWHSVGLLLELGEIKVRRLFYKRCIQLINTLENFKN